MLDKIDKGMLGGLTGFILSLFLVVYHEIQQNQETLRRIEQKLDHMHLRGVGTGIKIAEGGDNAEKAQGKR